MFVSAFETLVNAVGKERCEDSALAKVAEGVRVDVSRIRFGQYAWVGLGRFVACVQRIIVVSVATFSSTFAYFIHFASDSMVVWEGICFASFVRGRCTKNACLGVGFD